MKTHLLNLTQLAVLGLVLTIIPDIASATTSGKAVGDHAIKISYADLDLTSKEGVQVLYQRLRNAAEQVCDQRVGLREVIDVAMFKNECVETALADAVRSIDNELLHSLHNSDNS